MIEEGKVYKCSNIWCKEVVIAKCIGITKRVFFGKDGTDNSYFNYQMQDIAVIEVEREETRALTEWELDSRDVPYKLEEISENSNPEYWL
jgi:hypothetical protein